MLILAQDDNASAQSTGVFAAPLFGAERCSPIDDVKLRDSGEDYETARRREIGLCVLCCCAERHLGVQVAAGPVCACELR